MGSSLTGYFLNKAYFSLERLFVLSKPPSSVPETASAAMDHHSEKVSPVLGAFAIVISSLVYLSDNFLHNPTILALLYNMNKLLTRSKKIIL